MRVTTHTEGRVVTHEHDEPIEVVQLPNRDAAAAPAEVKGERGADAKNPPSPAPAAKPAKATPAVKAAVKQQGARIKAKKAR
jgi:hypothetical protein